MRSTDTWDPIRQNVAYRNEFTQSLGRLVGICEGLLGDQILTDQEVYFLRDWIATNDAVAYEFPGNVIAERIREVLADGIITEPERAHLVNTLRQVLGGRDQEAATAIKPIELGLDEPETIEFQGSVFCLTGDFVYGPRDVCERAIEARGGLVKAGVSRKIQFVVIGGLGSPEWKHGCFGTKIEKAMHYKRLGVPLAVVKEQCWASALSSVGGSSDGRNV